jgi:hypothetical protein
MSPCVSSLSNDSFLLIKRIYPDSLRIESPATPDAIFAPFSAASGVAQGDGRPPARQAVPASTSGMATRIQQPSFPPTTTERVSSFHVRRRREGGGPIGALRAHMRCTGRSWVSGAGVSRGTRNRGARDAATFARACAPFPAWGGRGWCNGTTRSP